MTVWRLRVQQVIQTFSAKDQDLPSAGQQFSFKSSREDNKNRNFTIRDFGSKKEFFSSCVLEASCCRICNVFQNVPLLMFLFTLT